MFTANFQTADKFQGPQAQEPVYRGWQGCFGRKGREQNTPKEGPPGLS